MNEDAVREAAGAPSESVDRARLIIRLLSIAAVLVALLLTWGVAGSAFARGAGHSSGGHYSSSGTSHARTTGTHHSGPAKAQGVKRDSHGRIARSTRAKHDFQRSHPCPSTGRTSGACPGYVIDHIKPLKRGGADSPSNMQWQTTRAAREKDKTE